jgi:hypothetical protein
MPVDSVAKKLWLWMWVGVEDIVLDSPTVCSRQRPELGKTGTNVTAIPLQALLANQRRAKTWEWRSEFGRILDAKNKAIGILRSDSLCALAVTAARVENHFSAGAGIARIDACAPKPLLCSIKGAHGHA